MRSMPQPGSGSSAFSSRKSSRKACGGWPRARSSRARAISARKRGRSSRGRDGGEEVERRRFGQEPVAPSLERVLVRRVDLVAVRPQVQPPPDGLRIDVTHEPADILDLPFAATPGGDRSRFDGSRRPGGTAGKPRPRAWQGASDRARSSTSPMSCSACISALRRVFEGGNSSVASASGSAVHLRCRHRRAAAVSFVGPWHRSGGKWSGQGPAAGHSAAPPLL